MPYINYGHTKMYYSLYRQNRKDIKVVIDLISKIVVFVPKTMSEDKIHQALSNKDQWIYTKVQELNEIQSNVSPKEFVSGEKLTYLGRQYRLKVYREAVDKTSFAFRQGRFVAVVQSHTLYIYVLIFSVKISIGGLFFQFEPYPIYIR